MNKNVLLIGPYNKVDGYLDTEAEMYMKKMFLAPPLGIHRIANYLRPKHNVVVYDPNVGGDPYKYLETVADRFDVVGFSLTHSTLEHDLSLIHAARKANPEALLVAGGEEATFNCQLVKRYSPIDMIVLGEGERTMEAVCNGRTVNYKGHMRMPFGNGGFEKATLDMDSASIPYEGYWDFLEKVGNNLQEIRTIRMFTSNYCPWSCAFCSSTNFLNHAYGCRVKPVSIGAEDLLLMIRRTIKVHPDVRTIFFQDDNFIGIAGQDRVFKLCKGILDYKIKGIIPEAMSFMCQTRANDVNEPILGLMASAGFRLVSYGVESFSQCMLDEFGKRIRIEQIDKALEWTYSARIVPFINIILTSPRCEISDIKITTKECQRHLERGAKLGVNLYTIPLLGSRMAKDAEDTIEYRRVKIFNTNLSFKKAERIIPRDKKVRKTLGLATHQLAEWTVEPTLTSADKSILNLKAIRIALEEVG